MTRQTIQVTGMSCGGCEQNVEDAISDLPGVTDVTADHGDDSVAVVHGSEVDDTEIHSAIEAAGYEVVS